MIILGLGSNIGDKLFYLRQAFIAIKQIPELTVLAVSPLYHSDALLNHQADIDWNKPYLNLAIRCQTSLTPLACLMKLKQIEINLGREKTLNRWEPRVIDIDILAWEDQIIDEETLKIPHPGLTDRHFALWPLADVAPLWIFPREGPCCGQTAAMLVEKWGSRFTGRAPLQTRQIHQRIDTSALVGIINVTPDSFSDGNQYLLADHALQQAVHLVDNGALILDIGAESTAPYAAVITPETEWERLQPVLSTLLAAKDAFLVTPKISVDTRHPETARRALDMGVDWINDVTGLQDPRMREIAASVTADYVVMHHLSIPASQQQVLDRLSDPTKLVYEWGESWLNQLEKSGIRRKRIIFDPGIGFGKSPEHSFLLIKNIQVFHQLGTRLLVGHSRKSFMALWSACLAQERDIETASIALHLAKEQVDYIRVHNVAHCARAIKTLCCLEN